MTVLYKYFKKTKETLLMNNTPRMNPNREYESLIGEFRIAKGMTVRELSEKSGVDVNSIVNLNNGMEAPIYLKNRNGVKGRWKPNAIKIAKALGVEVEVLFPRYVCIPDQQLTEEQVLEISMSKSTSIPAEQRVGGKELCAKVLELAKKILHGREKEFFNLLMTGHEISDIARIFDCTYSRAHGVTNSALKRVASNWNEREKRRNGKYHNPAQTKLYCEQYAPALD